MHVCMYSAACKILNPQNIIYHYIHKIMDIMIKLYFGGSKFCKQLNTYMHACMHTYIV